VTGDPGAGKSTLMIDVNDRLTGMGYQALYTTGEESLYQVRRVVKRLNLKNGYITSYDMEAEGIIEHCKRLRKKDPKKKLFLTIDSLPCIRIRQEEGRRGRPMGDEKQSMAGLEMIVQYCKNNWIPCFIIGHVTKKGDFAGKQTIKHLIDCHLHLSVDVDPDSGMEERIAEMKKNRFGPTGIYYPATMTAQGLVFEAETESFADEDGEDEE